MEREVRVINERGLHARPALKIVNAAAQFKSNIQLIKGGEEADAKSILDVIILAAICNSTVTIRASGEDEKAAIDAITMLFEQKFDEE